MADSSKTLVNPDDCALLLLDHQSGLFQTVGDISVAELRANVTVLVKAAKLRKMPVIMTDSVPDGPNGPLMPEILQNAPDAIYVARKGEISAWDNEDFVKAVQKTGKKTLIMAGVWTSVCVAFPALQAKADGYNVYTVIDASGDVNSSVSQLATARLAQAGVVPMSTNAMFCELQRTWARPDRADYVTLYTTYAPNYQAVLESYSRAQEAAARAAAATK